MNLLLFFNLLRFQQRYCHSQPRPNSCTDNSRFYMECCTADFFSLDGLRAKK